MDDDWVWRLRLATAHVDRDTVFLDVGCNTGVDAAKWLDVWGTAPGVLSAWRSHLRSHRAGSGVCKQNEKGSKGPASGQWQKPLANPTVFGVEPMPANVEILSAARRDVPRDSDAFQVVAAAVSDKAGMASFPAGKAGAEDLGLSGSHADGRRHKGNTVQVNVTTVDLLMDKYGHRRVDVLTIDTEGWDPSVLEGASNVLRTGPLLGIRSAPRRTREPLGQRQPARRRAEVGCASARLLLGRQGQSAADHGLLDRPGRAGLPSSWMVQRRLRPEGRHMARGHAAIRREPCLVPRLSRWSHYSHLL